MFIWVRKSSLTRSCVWLAPVGEPSINSSSICLRFGAHGMPQGGGTDADPAVITGWRVLARFAWIRGGQPRCCGPCWGRRPAAEWTLMRQAVMCNCADSLLAHRWVFRSGLNSKVDEPDKGCRRRGAGVCHGARWCVIVCRLLEFRRRAALLGIPSGRLDKTPAEIGQGRRGRTDGRSAQADHGGGELPEGQEALPGLPGGAGQEVADRHGRDRAGARHHQARCQAGHCLTA